MKPITPNGLVLFLGMATAAVSLLVWLLIAIRGSK